MTNYTLTAIRTYGTRQALQAGAMDKLTRQHEGAKKAMPHLFRQATNATVEPAPASTAQLNFLTDLFRQLDRVNPAASSAGKSWVIEHMPLSKVDASRAIDACKIHLNTPVGLNGIGALLVEPASAPVAPAPRPVVRSVAEILADVTTDRRYALLEPGTENGWKFYRVATSKAGRKYILIGHANGMGISWEYLQNGRQVAERIAADPHAAMLDFGRQLGKCGHCGRPLTNPNSRAKGIGPYCETL